MSKWYARTCSVNSDGDISRELFAPTAHLLSEKVRAEPPNHWAIWKDEGDGEGRAYKETWTTLWFSEGDGRFGELFCLDNQFGRPGAPLPPKENLDD